MARALLSSFGSVADLLINLTWKILCCCDIFLGHWEASVLFPNLFPQPTLTVSMDTVNLLLKGCQRRIQALTCVQPRTALALWKRLDLFTWKVRKSGPRSLCDLLIMKVCFLTMKQYNMTAVYYSNVTNMYRFMRVKNKNNSQAERGWGDGSLVECLRLRH